MNNGIRKSLHWLSQVVDGCLGMGAGEQPPANDSPGPANAHDIPMGLCDWEAMPNDTLCVQDISGSIAYTDVKPSRLDASQKGAQIFVRRRAVISPDDRIGVVAFNNHARVVLPLTEVHQLDKILLHIASLRAAGGTDIAEGLRAANDLFARDTGGNQNTPRFRRILLLTDGHGGSPLRWAKHLKATGVLIEVIGVGGNTSAVDEKLLRKIATTDSTGLNHYWFFRDTDSLIAHYEDLASGLIFRGHGP
jgi:uncharacterized protein YegL